MSYHQLPNERNPSSRGVWRAAEVVARTSSNQVLIEFVAARRGLPGDNVSELHLSRKGEVKGRVEQSLRVRGNDRRY